MRSAVTFREGAASAGTIAGTGTSLREEEGPAQPQPVLGDPSLVDMEVMAAAAAAAVGQRMLRLERRARGDGDLRSQWIGDIF